MRRRIAILVCIAIALLSVLTLRFVAGTFAWRQSSPPVTITMSDGTSVSQPLTQLGSDGPRLVVLYVPCTVNKDYLAPYNEAVGYTPHLKRFAEEAVVFDRHQTEAGQSGTAYASLFTGTQADRHGIYYQPAILRDDLYLISEAFGHAGYETYFWWEQGMAAADLNYGQGVPPQRTFNKILTGGDATFQRILRRLQSEPDFRAFVVANFTVTHSDYNYYPDAIVEFLEEFPDELQGVSRDEFETYRHLYLENSYRITFDFPRFVESNQLNEVDVAKLGRTLEFHYKACVHHLDRLFGELVGDVEAHDLMDDSLIAFTADHGEVVYRDNALFLTHGFQLAPEVLSVPLLMHVGESVEAGRYEAVTRSIDVFPTLVGLCHFALSPQLGIAGIDLSENVRSGPTAD